ncbi:MAG: 50S ribosomal protein L22 [Verrucomicrobiota bacterium]
MAVKAISKYARISAFKAREVTRHIQGRPAMDALEQLEFYPQKAARLIGKTLKSAIANAENNESMDPETLIIKEAIVGEGPTFKRFRPKARGSAGAIRKRTSHISITLEEREETPEPAKKPKAAAKKAAKKKPAKKQAEAVAEETKEEA